MSTAIYASTTTPPTQHTSAPTNPNLPRRKSNTSSASAAGGNFTQARGLSKQRPTKTQSISNNRTGTTQNTSNAPASNIPPAVPVKKLTPFSNIHNADFTTREFQDHILKSTASFSHQHFKVLPPNKYGNVLIPSWPPEGLIPSGSFKTGLKP